MNVLHRDIIQIVKSNLVVPHIKLQNELEDMGHRYQDIIRGIHETVQDSLIRRYEFLLGDEQTRRIFYMPANSRLML